MVIVGVFLYQVGIFLYLLSSGVVDVKDCYQVRFFIPPFGGIWCGFLSKMIAKTAKIVQILSCQV